MLHNSPRFVNKLYPGIAGNVNNVIIYDALLRQASDDGRCDFLVC